jgi:phage baseplate assembly protein W
MATNTKIYSDLDLTFRRTPGKGDVAMSYDEQAVIRSVRNLLFTKKYDRRFQPNIESRLPTLLFEPVSPIIASQIQDEIIRIINNHEPRATVDSVNVISMPDQNFFSATITIFIGNNTQPTSFNLILKRVR